VKTIQEQIEVMQHFANGGEIEFFHGAWVPIIDPDWNWSDYNYRITKPKKTVTIEKWLVNNKMYNTYSILETDKIDILISTQFKKIKLLQTYKVEL
jgi:hypothetical protein